VPLKEANKSPRASRGVKWRAGAIIPRKKYRENFIKYDKNIARILSDLQ